MSPSANLTRTAVELLLAYINYTNSCHSNSADEPFTTPTEEYVRLAAHGQAIVLEETGLFKHMMNLFGGSPGMQIVEREVERGVLDYFREIDRLGGVLACIEQRYQRSQIQEESMHYEMLKHTGEYPIIGVNTFRNPHADPVPQHIELARSTDDEKQGQLTRLRDFHARHGAASGPALKRLQRAVIDNANVFAVLMEAVRVCSLGQITTALFEVGGQYRRSM